ncbi:hypothetical protein SAMN02910456_02333 [Ruminococcaceae bacterium YRB3002]|nr:hypothetical protein SAMN02910456_02333 [Ruminococcaceae bacterium YRB3002]
MGRVPSVFQPINEDNTMENITPDDNKLLTLKDLKEIAGGLSSEGNSNCDHDLKQLCSTFIARVTSAGIV